MNEIKQPEQPERSPFDGAVGVILTRFAEAMIEELRGADPGRFARVMRLCEMASALQREIATSVDDFAGDDDMIAVAGLGGPRFGRRRPVRMGPMLGEDQAELARNQIAIAEQALDDTVDKTQLKALDLLLRMHDKDFQNDKELEEIYALVRTDVLRRLQAHRQGQDTHAAESHQSHRDREEAAG